MTVLSSAVLGLILLARSPLFLCALLDTTNIYAFSNSHDPTLSRAAIITVDANATCRTSQSAFAEASHSLPVCDPLSTQCSHLLGLDSTSGITLLRAWDANFKQVRAPVELARECSIPTAWFFNTGSRWGELLSLNLIGGSVALSAINATSGGCLKIQQYGDGLSWIVPSSAYDFSAGIVYQVRFCAIQQGKPRVCSLCLLQVSTTMDPKNASLMNVALVRLSASSPAGSVALYSEDEELNGLLKLYGLWAITAFYSDSDMRSGTVGIAGIVPADENSNTNVLVIVDVSSGSITRAAASPSLLGTVGASGAFGSTIFVDTTQELAGGTVINRLYTLQLPEGKELSSCEVPLAAVSDFAVMHLM